MKILKRDKNIIELLMEHERPQEKIMNELLDRSKMNSSAIYLVVGDQAQVLESININQSLKEIGKISIDRSPIHRILSLKKMVSLHRSDPDNFEEFFSQFNINSYIGFPIFSRRGTILGILELTSPDFVKIKDDFYEKIKPLLWRVGIEMEVELLAKFTEDLKRRVENVTEKDPLTGLYKKSMLADKLEQEFARAKRYGRPLSCVLIELTNIPDLEHTYGTQFANYVITEVSRTLKNGIRMSDHLFRYGIKEFFIILPETKIEDTFILAERLRFEIENMTFKIKGVIRDDDVDEESTKVNLSFGLSSYPNEKITTPVEMIHSTDNFISQSKIQSDHLIH